MSFPCSASICLAKASPEHRDAGGGRSFLLVSLLFQAFSSLQGHPQALAEALSMDRSRRGPAWWPPQQLRVAQPQGQSGARHAWTQAPAVPCTAMVAGSNPPVIVFYCVRLDITTR